MQFHKQLHNFLLPYNDTLLQFVGLESSQYKYHSTNIPNFHKIRHNVDLVSVFGEMSLKYYDDKILHQMATETFIFCFDNEIGFSSKAKKTVVLGIEAC